MHRTPLTFFGLALATLALATITGQHGGNSPMSAETYWLAFSAFITVGILWYAVRGFDHMSTSQARETADLEEIADRLDDDDIARLIEARKNEPRIVVGFNDL
ncbi:hypothetical protein [Paraburkholderia sp. C35]|uniref:hypothetical protein n=1 Tax=Paraburkholderia sp. C35 TaxID=2126993 RepID=UPI000D68DB7B|nr:hypothetical protein [Paraburkholderia sp. C35]